MIRINEEKREKCQFDEKKEEKNILISRIHLNKLCNLIRAQTSNCLNVYVINALTYKISHKKKT